MTRIFDWLHSMSSPIFSKLHSSSNKAGRALVRLSFMRMFLRILVRNPKRGVLPVPVGIATTIHKITGSSHIVPGTFTALCAMKKLTSIRSPHKTASGGISTAFPACLQPCVTNSHTCTLSVPPQKYSSYFSKMCSKKIPVKSQVPAVLNSMLQCT